MSFLAAKLRNRIKICDATQTPDSTDGTIDISYNVLLECWAELKTIGAYVRAMRGVAAGSLGESGRYGYATHVFKIRKNSAQLGYAFSSGFSTAFDTIVDLNPVKNTMFIFLMKDDNAKGRRFRVQAIRHDERFGEFLMIECEEEFEEGTGWGSL